ncbi:MAG TPA: hypothetical protein VGX76_15185 [Pirellulales bacterium]|jgi:hypothetical protein|nr:hypothetical protein [Pirellulales bacterium]
MKRRDEIVFGVVTLALWLGTAAYVVAVACYVYARFRGAPFTASFLGL